jgi:hypothetical protein
MYIVKNGDATQLLTNFREADASQGVKNVSDEKIVETLFLIKSLKDYIELYEKSYKEEAISRNISAVDEKRELKLLIENGKSSTEVDADKVFKSLPYDQFITLVKVVQSKAETELQTKAIEDASTKIPSDSKVLTIRTLSKTDKAKLKG